MIRLAGLGHILLRVMDLERSKKFYSEVLGFHILDEDPEHGGTFMALPGQSHLPMIGISAVGQPSCARTASASSPPRPRKIIEEIRN